MNKTVHALANEDFNASNQDYRGIRHIQNQQEVVDYYRNSSVRIWLNKENTHYPAHWHTAIEVIVPCENHYDVIIGKELYRVMPGEVLIIPSGELHELVAPASGSRFIYLFDLSALSKLPSFQSLQIYLAQPIHITPSGFLPVYHTLYDKLIQIRNEYFEHREFTGLSIFSLLIDFFVQLGYHQLDSQALFPNTSDSKRSEYALKFQSLLTYIDENYMLPLTLENIAESIGFSKYHFSRLFKQYTGYTFCDYITLRRIKVAEELLAQPNLSISQVASLSGFSSISTFNRLFKQYKEYSPSEYRNKKSHIMR